MAPLYREGEYLNYECANAIVLMAFVLPLVVMCILWGVHVRQCKGSTKGVRVDVQGYKSAFRGCQNQIDLYAGCYKLNSPLRIRILASYRTRC